MVQELKSALFQFQAIARNITAVSDSLAPDIGYDLIYLGKTVLYHYQQVTSSQ